MSIDITCNCFDVNESFWDNQWLVVDDHGNFLPKATIIDNLSKFYHDQFLKLCKEDIRLRNATERKPLTMDSYMKRGLHKDFMFMERKSKDVLLLKSKLDKVEFNVG